jgi:hypothetical protein
MTIKCETTKPHLFFCIDECTVLKAISIFTAYGGSLPLQSLRRYLIQAPQLLSLNFPLPSLFKQVKFINK